jgi:hypothetical protein
LHLIAPTYGKLRNKILREVQLPGAPEYSDHHRPTSPI